MRKQRLIEQAEGRGTIANAEPPVTVGYTVIVHRWNHVIESRDSISESPGTFSIEATLDVPPAAKPAILRLFAANTPAELVLQDGRKARLLIVEPGSLTGSGTSHARCQVNALDGYG